jgi:hypothetical protein
MLDLHICSCLLVEEKNEIRKWLVIGPLTLKTHIFINEGNSNRII